MRKPVFGVSDQMIQSGCTTAENDYGLKILDLGSRGLVLSM